MGRPAPLVPRHLGLPVAGRMNRRGEPLVPVDDASVLDLGPTLEKYGVQALAVGLLHAYANPAHEIRVAEILKSALPDLWITRASDVCPEIREYERQSTACANAYVQPVMRSEERRVGQSVSVRVDSGGRRIIKKKKTKK